jgi:nucleotide-binding universal stress UspA family protein
MNSGAGCRRDQLRLAKETEELAEEVKLLAINLAITLAKVQSQEQTIKGLEPQFSELVKRANEASYQVTAILQGVRNQRKMEPIAETIIKDQSHVSVYDKMEISLNNLNNLSQNIIRTITRIKQQQVG